MIIDQSNAQVATLGESLRLIAAAGGLADPKTMYERKNDDGMLQLQPHCRSRWHTQQCRLHIYTFSSHGVNYELDLLRTRAPFKFNLRVVGGRAGGRVTV